MGTCVLTGRIRGPLGLAWRCFTELVEGPEDDGGSVHEDRQEGHAGQEGGEGHGHDVAAIPQVQQDDHHG